MKKESNKQKAANGSRTRPKRARVRAAAQPSPRAAELLGRANSRARERHTAVRHAFIGKHEPAGTGIPPMARLLRESRGGIRLKFYLALLWQAGGGDERHSIAWPARAWAELLDLPDPEGRGERRIRDAIRSLEHARLLKTQRAPGHPVEVVLQSDSGDDTQYIHPGEVAHASKEKGERPSSRELYVQLPPGFWTRGWILVLSGPALAMLLIMLALTQNGAKAGVWLSPSQARARYCISEDTWTRGIAELQRYGLLGIHRKPVSEDFGWRRVRNTFTIQVARLDEAPTLVAD